MTLPFDAAEARRFLTLLAEGEDRHITFQTFDDAKVKRRELSRVIQARAHVLDELAQLNAKGVGIFVCVNRTDGKGRKAENITAVRALFADLDGAPLEPVLNCGCTPHMVVASSPERWHAYWRVDDCPLERFKPLQRALARRFDGDPDVNDLPRVMRLPGSVNHKHEQPFPVRILEASEQQPLHTDAAVRALSLDISGPAPSSEHVSDEALARTIAAGTEPGVHKALRTLAARLARRGKDADEIVAQLHALMDAAPWRERDPQRWQARRDEIPRLAEGAGKFRPEPHANGASATLRNNLANAIDGCALVLPKLQLEVWDSGFYGTRFGRRGEELFRWADHHDLEVAAHLQREPAYERISTDHVRQAVDWIATQEERDEMVEWLEALTWDGTGRLDYLAVDAFGVDERTEFGRRAMANHLVACVARQYAPGIKFDHMLILEGKQGTRKSSALAALFGPDYVAEIHADPTSRDAMMLLRGKLAADLTELSGMRRAELERFKAWITLQADEYRLPYGRRTVTVPRRFVIVATTNESEYLLDPTGNRRFLPIRCGEINLDYLRENRAQLFAEAVQRYRDGYPFYELPIKQAQEAQAERLVADPWEATLATALVGKTQTTVAECLRALEVPSKDHSRSTEARVAACLRSIEWYSLPRRREKGALIRPWTRKERNSGT